jgi:hypothetical protein
MLKRDESRFNNTLYKDTGVAQLVEHWSPKPGVGSSSLSSRAKIYQYYGIKNIF